MTDVAALRRAAVRYPGVAAVWVFGSVVRGEPRLDSDLDIAVLLDDPQATAADARRVLGRMAADFESASGRTVDVVVLSQRDPILAREVLSSGALLVDADPERRVAFTAEVLSRYLDWAPRYDAAVERALRHHHDWAAAKS